jgi:prepilin-type N-terminal cleavage/methylation domain-containing protein
MDIGKERRGFAMLEVLVSLTLLALGSATVIPLLLQWATVLHRARAAESKVATATMVMNSASMLTTEQLQMRSGLSKLGGMLIKVATESDRLFSITIYDSAMSPLLETTVYRSIDANQKGIYGN